MYILGYDPGTTNQGFALLEFDPSKKTVKLSREWTLNIKDKQMKNRLSVTHNFVKNLILGWRELYYFASERIVVTGNGRDNQNRIMGVILLALGDVSEKFLVPSEVKKAVCGYHRGSKDAIAFAVAKMLNLEEGYEFSSNHASDAAAVALTYLIQEFKYPNGSTELNND